MQDSRAQGHCQTNTLGTTIADSQPQRQAGTRVDVLRVCTFTLAYHGHHCMQSSGKSFHPNAGVGQRSNVHFLLTFSSSEFGSMWLEMHGNAWSTDLSLILPCLLVFIRGEHVEEGPSSNTRCTSAEIFQCMECVAPPRSQLDILDVDAPCGPDVQEHPDAHPALFKK